MAEPIDLMAERMAREEAGYTLSEKPKAGGRALFAFEMLGDMPETEDAPDWLIEDLIETDTTVQVFGDPGCCKSFVALSVALSCAAGVPWFGRTMKQGPVLYVAGEGRRGLKRRARAWSRDMNLPLKALPMALSTTATQLTDPIASAELLAVIAAFTQAHGKPALIVFDTLARNFGPADENSTQDMTTAVSTLDAVRDATGATILIVHHTGHADKTRARGSIVMYGALDHEYRLTRDPDGLITCHNTKTKDGEEPPDLHFKLENVALGYNDSRGKPVHSAVLRSCDPPPPPPLTEGRSARGKHQRTALDTLSTLQQVHARNLEKGGYPAGQAKVTVEEWRTACLASGVPYNRFYELQKTLVDGGFVRIGEGHITLNEVRHDP